MKYTLAALAALTVGANAATITLHDLAGSQNNQANFTAAAGFSFTTGSDINTKLSSITVAGPSTGASATTFGLEVYVDADNDAATYGLGSLFATSTNTTTLANNTLNVFNFSQEVWDNNQTYIAVFTDGAGTQINARFGMVNGATDAGTTSFSNGAPIFLTTHEAAITVTAVPEPSSTALLGLGGLALILRRRK